MLIIGNVMCKLRSNLRWLFWTTVSVFSLVVPVSAMLHSSVACSMFYDKWLIDWLKCHLRMRVDTGYNGFTLVDPGVNGDRTKYTQLRMYWLASITAAGWCMPYDGSPTNMPLLVSRQTFLTSQCSDMFVGRWDHSFFSDHFVVN